MKQEDVMLLTHFNSIYTNITSTWNQYKITDQYKIKIIIKLLMRYFILFFIIISFKGKCVFYTYNSSQFISKTFIENNLSYPNFIKFTTEKIDLYAQVVLNMYKIFQQLK